MQKSTAATHQFSYTDTASTTEAATPDTTPQLIALAVSLVGDQNKVMEQMRCSEADFCLYRSGEKELPFPELDRLASLIIDEQQRAIGKHRESLKAIRREANAAPAVIEDSDDVTTPKPNGVPDDPVKSERFIDAARALGVKESEGAFDKAMRALLKLKPKR